MANKQQKKGAVKAPVKKGKTQKSSLQQEQAEKINWKQVAKDERTWKITGMFLILIGLFLLISFLSYFFTWNEDQDKVLSNGAAILWKDDIMVKNLLGRLGAYSSDFFIRRGFGISSLLFCTFFLVAGANLLFSKKIFSLAKNLKYITLGVLVLSVSFAFVFTNSQFPYGGAVGTMVNNSLTGVLGKVGTGAVLLLFITGYVIWQFNPAFNLPRRKQHVPVDKTEPENIDEEIVELNTTNKVAPLPVSPETPVREPKTVPETTQFKPVVIPPMEEESVIALTIIEKDTPVLVENTPMKEEDIIDEVFEEEDEEDAIVDIEEDIEEPEELELPASRVTVTPPSVAGKEISLSVTPKNIHASKPVNTALENSSEVALEIKQVEEKRPETIEEVTGLAPYDPILDLRNYKYPGIDLLATHGSEQIIQDTEQLENHKNQIITTLRNYSIEIVKISATVGPTVTLFEIVPAPGIRISRIKNLEDDIALSLAALGIRIIAPIPGKGTIGIEVPNLTKTVVSMRTLINSEKFKNNNFSLPIAIGKSIDNENFVVDLATMPHLLMAGATGQGKSVGLNALLVSLLYKKHPSQLKLVLIDPKKVELSVYRLIERHFLAKLPGEEEAIITDTKKVINTLNSLCIEMDQRYDLLKDAGSRNIKEYNEKFTKRRLNPEKGHKYLPFIVLVIDEFADLIMTAGKEVEMPIGRLAQLARAVGIHLIIATQRPSVNIITGTIKANFPARIAFKVSSKIDSRTILDAGGAEQLIGKGDMLISYNGNITRLQCAFVDTPEVEEIVDHIADQQSYTDAFFLPEYVDEKDLDTRLGSEYDGTEDRDAMFEDAARLIVQAQVGSTSLLQRRMKLGYNRAGRLMDQLEDAGIVGPNQGSKAREVLIKTDMELQERLAALG